MLEVTFTVNPDEKAYLLSEINEKTADERGWHRIQRVYVNRDGHIAVWQRDMGDASLFTAPQVRIISMWEDSVAYLMDQADRQRWGEDYWQKFLEEQQAGSTLIKRTVAFVEEGAKLAHNQSVFGPGFTKQRNLFIRRPA